MNTYTRILIITLTVVSLWVVMLNDSHAYRPVPGARQDICSNLPGTQTLWDLRQFGGDLKLVKKVKRNGKYGPKKCVRY